MYCESFYTNVLAFSYTIWCLIRMAELSYSSVKGVVSSIPSMSIFDAVVSKALSPAELWIIYIRQIEVDPCSPYG